MYASLHCILLLIMSADLFRCCRLKPALLGARKAVPIPIRQHDDLDDWVSDDGPLVLIGEAAHPFPVSPLTHPLLA